MTDEADQPATWVISHCIQCNQVAIRHHVDDPDRICKWCRAGVTLATSWAGQKEHKEEA